MARWALSEAHRMVRGVTTALESFDTQRAGTLMASYVDDLSNWYVRRSRRRFWDADADAFDPDLAGRGEPDLETGALGCRRRGRGRRVRFRGVSADRAPALPQPLEDGRADRTDQGKGEQEQEDHRGRP